MRLIDGMMHRLALRKWRQTARTAPTMPLSGLRRSRARARSLSLALHDVISVADHRLALPMIGSGSFTTPHGTDWSWRPELWRMPLETPGLASVPSRSRLGREVTLFHDCTRSELSLRQLRNTREADLAPFGLRMDVFAFDGSFLSLVLDLPQQAVDGLKRRHLIRMNTIVELEKPLEIFARLNIRHGPNSEQIVRELPLNTEAVMVEFDLAYTNLNEKRVERAWIDLIFENPQMSQVVLRDLTFSRRPRADL
ncbi:MAG: hypothetical protein COW54_15000 [Rhodobacteraceae bacterium CG17_big_fil_post_rev_8_21_14_2_50_63_15]|nr:hypothetical protein [Roseovarius sp.]PIV77407.1 MAG: hypothetical protein COW54_15000 [Rhodobacteraceae bacterium CG17_big_fil_post_rev_8_21_14_2_50_63_15]